MDIMFIKARWIQLQGTVKAKIGKITLDNTLELNGTREAMVARLQAHHQLSRDEAEVQAAILRLKAIAETQTPKISKTVLNNQKTSIKLSNHYLM